MIILRKILLFFNSVILLFIEKISNIMRQFVFWHTNEFNGIKYMEKLTVKTILILDESFQDHCLRTPLSSTRIESAVMIILVHIIGAIALVMMIVIDETWIWETFGCPIYVISHGKPKVILCLILFGM